jgi:hypothetical protein
LLRQCLEVVDADHLPAFLEPPNPRTIPFYERHGFEVTSVAQLVRGTPRSVAVSDGRLLNHDALSDTHTSSVA